MERLFKVIDHSLHAMFAPTRTFKVIEEDTLLGHGELCPLFLRLERSDRRNEALVLHAILLFDFDTTEVPWHLLKSFFERRLV
jgi:hypothetical protein